MRSRALHIGLMAIVLLTAGVFESHVVLGQTADPNEPIMGTWKLIPAKSALNRGGPTATPPPVRPATWVFSPEADGGFRMSEYDGDPPPAKSNRTYVAKFDGKEYTRPGGRGAGETLTHWQISPNLIIRLAKSDGKPTEWVSYAVSTDGNVLTATSWEPETPEYHNVRVFEREK